jgi:multicomponent Na+:H+ antiporter subunit D
VEHTGAMIFFAALCIVLGVAPGPLFYLQLLLFSGLAFFLLLGWLKRTLTITLDVDWFYRRLGPAFAHSLNRLAGAAWNTVVSATALGACETSERSSDITGPKAFWPAPGRPAAWRFGRPSCWPPIWSSRTYDREVDV